MRNLGNIILLRDGYCSAPVANEREPLDRYRPTLFSLKDAIHSLPRQHVQIKVFKQLPRSDFNRHLVALIV